MHKLRFLFMDITLVRILSLIPKKDDGTFKHGAKAEFGRSLGYDGGEIINMWEKGASTSYVKKLHEISAKYNVSLEWLRGETDDPSQKKKPATDGDRLNPDYMKLNAANRAAIDAAIAALLKSQQQEG